MHPADPSQQRSRDARSAAALFGLLGERGEHLAADFAERLSSAALRAGDWNVLVGEVDERLFWQREPRAVRTFEPVALPFRDLAAAALEGDGGGVHAGMPALGVSAALELVRRSIGVELSSSRVRVGVSRGHLLSVVVAVPLDVSGDVATLEAAASLLVEAALGDDFVDQWLLSIDVTRTRRNSGLMMVHDSVDDSVTYPVEELCELARLGSTGISASLPASLAQSTTDAWTALELELAGAGPGAERTFAATTEPEALKAALEGLPFDSRRFVTGPEIFVWTHYSADGQQNRHALRARVEAAATELGGGIRLAGTGFGVDGEYLDFWLRAEHEELARLGVTLAEAAGVPITLGFYDTRWAEHRLGFR